MVFFLFDDVVYTYDMWHTFVDWVYRDILTESRRIYNIVVYIQPFSCKHIVDSNLNSVPLTINFELFSIYIHKYICVSRRIFSLLVAQQCSIWYINNWSFLYICKEIYRHGISSDRLISYMKTCNLYKKSYGIYFKLLIIC